MSLTNSGLVEHCKKALNEKWGYVYGTYGTVLTESLLLDKLKQYPQNIQQYLSFIRTNWMNKRVTDCVGLLNLIYGGPIKALYTIPKQKTH